MQSVRSPLLVPAPDGGDDLVGIGGPSEGLWVVGLSQEAVDPAWRSMNREPRESPLAGLRPVFSARTGKRRAVHLRYRCDDKTNGLQGKIHAGNDTTYRDHGRICRTPELTPEFSGRSCRAYAGRTKRPLVEIPCIDATPPALFNPHSAAVVP